MTDQVSLTGFIHNVSETKKSKQRSFPYFNFSLQVSDKETHRGVCYDSSKESILRGYQDSRQPATLTNVTKKRSLLDSSKDDIIINKRSRVEPATTSVISFEYDEHLTAEHAQELTSLDNIASVDEGQLSSVKGIITLQHEHIKEYSMQNSTTVPMLNRCVITDHTASVRLTLWGNTIKEAINHPCCIMTSVRVKNFNGVKYLSSTPSTTLTETEEKFPLPSEELFDSFFRATKILVDHLRVADSFKTWRICTKCAKPIPQSASADTTIVKCENCNAVQPVSSCEINASVRVAVRRDTDYELIWLTAFKPVLQQMLQQPSEDISINSSEDQVYNQLFKLKNFELEYDDTSFVINNVYF